MAFFATMAGSGSRQAFDELRRILRCIPQAELAVTEQAMAGVGRLAVRAKIEPFVQQLAPEGSLLPLRAAWLWRQAP